MDLEKLQKNYHEYYQSFVRPKPVRERVDFLERFGLESLFVIVYVLSSALLSALRTGSVFAEIEERLLAGTMMEQFSGFLSAVAGILSLAAIEGSLFAFGYSEARRGKAGNVPKAVIILSLATVIAAGFYASSKAFVSISGWSSALEMFVAFSTAIAPPLLAFFGGASVGKIHLEYVNAVARAEREYQERMKQWEESLNRSFVSWAARNGIRVAGMIQTNEANTSEQTEQTIVERTSKQTNLPEQTGWFDKRTNRELSNEFLRTNSRTSEQTNVRANEQVSERSSAERTNFRANEQTSERSTISERTNVRANEQISERSTTSERTNVRANGRDAIERIYRSLIESGISPTVGLVSAEYARLVRKRPEDVKGYVSQVLRVVANS